MGCLKLLNIEQGLSIAYKNPLFFSEGEQSKPVSQKKNGIHYYPFGMQMPGRNWTSANSDGYRFGFNGMEKDDEVKGQGNSYDFGARIYDPRLGKFLSLDPRMADFSWWSPYHSAANNPIYFIDENGEGPRDWFISLWLFLTGKGSAPADADELERMARASRTVPRVIKRHEELNERFETAEKVAEFVPGVNVASATMNAESTRQMGGIFVLLVTDAFGGEFIKPIGKILKTGVNYVISRGAGKIDNLISIAYKYTDEGADLVTSTGKINGEGEIITTLSESTFENGVKVAEEYIGNLGDDAVNKIGKPNRGIQSDNVLGKQSADGSKGYRIDFEGGDNGKGTHINWWNGNEKGAILLEASENQYEQIIKNEIPK